MTSSAARPLRADASRSVQAILSAADRVLSENPSASMEQVAEAAGVARTTVHRHFANREALAVAMARSALTQLADAVDRARPDTTPPLVALYQVTANVLRVKSAWPFSLTAAASNQPDVAQLHAGIDDRCEALFERARGAGLLRSDTDIRWARRVYYALIGEALRSDVGTAPDEPADVDDTDALATRLVDTFLYGVAARPT